MFERMLANQRNPADMERSKHVHFVGIGGAGMSGIAEVLINLGFVVSGSDVKENAVINHLSSLGATIYIGHSEENIANADVVVKSSAIQADNPELELARKKRIPVVPRAAMLAELMRFRYGIAVAGTHGKTTTTSLTSSILAEGGLDPTYVIGGKLNSAKSNARLGASRYFVAEADESDASFLLLQPMIAIVTNIDADHMATYHGDFTQLRHAFIEFLQHLPFYGLAVLCIDDEEVMNIIPEVSRPVITYGLHELADYRATNIKQHFTVTHFDLSRPGQEEWLRVKLNLPGIHNVQNAIAACVVAHELGVADEHILSALAEFQGITRRFQIYGEKKLGNANVLMIDDYGHHPREIESVFKTIKSGWPDRRLVVIFQPHRFSRTRDLFDDFASVLGMPDLLILTEVYAAGEGKIPGADGRALTRAVRARGGTEPIFVESLAEIPELLVNVVQDQDILLTLGAGDIGTMPGVLSENLPVVKH